jgi:Transposase.
MEWRHINMKEKLTSVPPVGYIMATVFFWNDKGVILAKFLPRAPAVNSDHYAETLKPLSGHMII